MKLALLGATGNTGSAFLKKALEYHEIKALVRDPSKLELKHSNLEVIKGDALNSNDVDKIVEGTHVAVSLIGHVKGSPKFLQTEAVNNLVESMKKHNVKRLISLTGAGVRDAERDKPNILDHLIVFVMKYLSGPKVRKALLDGERHLEVVMNSGLEWTIVRAPRITKEAEKGNIEVGHVGTIEGMKISREDLAQFILDELTENNHIYEMPYITNG